MRDPERAPKLTVSVIARDEEKLIGKCLESVAWADEIVVVIDSRTIDATHQIARTFGARLVDHDFVNFATQRNHALTVAKGEWVLFLDADERVTPQLRSEIDVALDAEAGYGGYWIPRHNYIVGRLVRGAGWYPDYQLRLLRRAAARFDPDWGVHEVAVVEGAQGYLANPLVHLNYTSWTQLIDKQRAYSALEAERWLATRGVPRRRALIGQPARELWRRYVELAGFKEGPLGLALSILLAWYAGRTIYLARRRGLGSAGASEGTPESD